MTKVIEAEIVEAPKPLPEIEVVLNGKIQKSNLTEFCDQLKTAIKSLNRDLVTDYDFKKAEEQVKFLKDAEKSLKAGKDKMLKDAEQLYKHLSQFDGVGGECRDVRLGLESQINTRKKERKAEILESNVIKVNALNPSFYRSRIESAMKGKKSFETMELAATEQVEAINAEISDARKLIDNAVKEHGKTLFPDDIQLEQMQAELLKIEINRRVERAEAEAERKQLEAEKLAAQKAQAEAEKQAIIIQTERASEQALQNDKRTEKNEAEVGPVTAEAEILVYCGQVKRAFASLKEIRATLKHERSMQAVEIFSRAVNAAYFELKKEGSE